MILSFILFSGFNLLMEIYDRLGARYGAR